MGIFEFIKTKLENTAFGGGRGRPFIMNLTDFTPAQREFMLSNARHTLIGGPIGAGKTYVVRKVLEQNALKYPGIRICVFGVDRNKLHIAYAQPLKEALNGKADLNKFMFPYLALKNGSTIEFRSVPYVNAERHYAGLEYEIIALQDAQELTEKQMEFLTALNRTTTRRKPFVLYEAIPGGPGHEWIKRLFIDKHYRHLRERAEDYHFVKATAGENKYLMQDKEYQKAITSLPEDRRRALIEGDWDELRAAPDASAGEGAE